MSISQKLIEQAGSGYEKLKRKLFSADYEETKSPMKENSDSDEVDEEHKKKFAEAWEKRRKEKSEQQAKRDVALSDDHY